jgi:hypothetical protein
MPEQADPRDVEREVSNARAAVQRDIAELDATVHAEREAAKARVQDNAAAIAGGAAALGLLIGLGGKKALKALLAVGVPAAAAYFYVRQQQDARDDAEAAPR